MRLGVASIAVDAVGTGLFGVGDKGIFGNGENHIIILSSEMKSTVLQTGLVISHK